MITFKDINETVNHIYKGIIPDIQKKYGPVDFENSMGSLLVKKGGKNIGLIKKKTLDKWEEIIDANLERIKKLPKEPKEHKISNMQWDKQKSGYWTGG